mmetsp:Transcript_42994/g.113289  ORF Transcript_42994/g.113289 Transcript_42994/m.113289 type:complete len:121 (+) Transcript_42994:200-562(+)
MLLLSALQNLAFLTVASAHALVKTNTQSLMPPSESREKTVEAHQQLVPSERCHSFQGTQKGWMARATGTTHALQWRHGSFNPDSTMGRMSSAGEQPAHTQRPQRLQWWRRSKTEKATRQS